MRVGSPRRVGLASTNRPRNDGVGGSRSHAAGSAWT
uniref:Uncharacterized protein n=1 Tax=Arundo donax TaxID=35708 RepID=A0A0A9F8N1_ARUDO